VLDPVTIHREGNGQPIVLLHCLGVDHRLWKIATEDLASEFELISYDFPGHGTSPVPNQAYTIEDLAEQLCTLIEKENLGRVHLAGISLGGLVAQRFAAVYPEKLGKLVLIDTTPRYTDEMRQAWHDRAGVARTRGVAAMIGHLLDVWFTAEFIAQNGPAVRYVRECLERCSGEGYARACETLAAADLRVLLKQISAPTMVICGKQDIPSFIDAAHQLQSEIAGSELIWLEPARHASILEQPDAFTRALSSFLA
jgi:3-oxoadipate enol-lactonase